MDIYFGSNKYALVPGSGINNYGDNIEIQLLAKDLDLNILISVLNNPINTKIIKVVDKEANNHIVQVIQGYSQLDHIVTKYNQVYQIEYEEIIVVPSYHDSETGEEIPAQTETVEHKLITDIIYLFMKKSDLKN